MRMHTYTHRYIHSIARMYVYCNTSIASGMYCVCIISIARVQYLTYLITRSRLPKIIREKKAKKMYGIDE